MNAKWFHIYLSWTLIRSGRIKKWQVSSFCSCSCSLCTSGFLYKMLLKTVASILLLNLNKNKDYLSMMLQLLFKKNVFLDIIEQFGTRPRSRNTITYILCQSRVRCLILTVEIHMLVYVYIAIQMPPSGSSLWVCFINGHNVITLVVKFFVTLKVKKSLH